MEAIIMAASCGIPSVLLERGGMGAWETEEVRSMKRDVRSILRFLGIYDGHRSMRKYYPLNVTDVQYQSASYTGLWYPQKRAGDLFTEGEILGYVKDYEDNILETCTSYGDGVILYQTGSLQVIKDGPMVAYGRISYEEDDRKEKIAAYWTKRSDSFLEQRRAELHSPLAKRWLEEIEKYLPKKALSPEKKLRMKARKEKMQLQKIKEKRDWIMVNLKSWMWAVETGFFTNPSCKTGTPGNRHRPYSGYDHKLPDPCQRRAGNMRLPGDGCGAFNFPGRELRRSHFPKPDLDLTRSSPGLQRVVQSIKTRRTSPEF